MRNGKSTRRRRSAPKATAWVARVGQAGRAVQGARVNADVAPNDQSAHRPAAAEAEGLPFAPLIQRIRQIDPEYPFNGARAYEGPLWGLAYNISCHELSRRQN